MKKINLIPLILFFIISGVRAQKVYFIYLQSENQRPFYARLGEKIYNSTSSGYLILSNLRDSSYTINVGIKDSGIPDIPYSVTVNKKDQGFLLKNFGEKGWGLFNFQSMATIMPEAKNTSSNLIVKTEKVENNAFTDLLAKASDDSTIKERPVIIKEVAAKKATPDTLQENRIANVDKNSDPIKPTEKKNPPVQDTTVAAVDDEPVKNKNDEEESSINKVTKTDSSIKNVVRTPEEKITPAIQDESTKISENISAEKNGDLGKSVVKLKSESSTTEGIKMTFLDSFGNGNIDTVIIMIPAETRKIVESVKQPGERTFLEPIPLDSVRNNIQPEKNMVNPNCNQQATDDDFFKLRRKMAGENSDENMIEEARKVFRTKCFSTLQIKNLGSLFLTDEAKYRFFDAAYSFVNDVTNFPQLQAELKDEYYINRFKAMLRY